MRLNSTPVMAGYRMETGARVRQGKGVGVRVRVDPNPNSRYGVTQGKGRERT